MSLLANAGLVATVLWLARHPRPDLQNISLNPMPGVESSESTPQPSAASPATPSEHRQKFHWSQLESTDYRTYIANLREIGCPPQTIRDLIVADVDSVYAGRREQLLRQHAAGTPAADLGPYQALQTGLQQLQNEEAGVLRSLLEPSSGSNVTTAAAAAVASNPPTPVRRSRFQDQKPALPLVFQDPGPELKLNPTQLGVIANLKESFNEELSGLNLDPSDPEYLKRWQAAQRDADEKMSALLGGDFTQNYQIQAADQSPSKK